jgi:hypothetical protein
MKNVLDPCDKCPEALCLTVDGEERGAQRARPSLRLLDHEAEDAGHRVADDPWLHAEKAFEIRSSHRPLLHRIDIDVGHRRTRAQGCLVHPLLPSSQMVLYRKRRVIRRR